MGVGDIGAVIDTLEFDTTFCNYPSMIHISGDIYAIIYIDTNGQRRVITIAIDSDGDIGAAGIDSWLLCGTGYVGPFLIHISGNVYAMVCENATSDGLVLTFTIETNGTIGGAALDYLIFQSTQCKFPKIIHVAGTTYAIVYSGQFDDGFLTTVTISAAGDITDPVIETVEFMLTDCVNPDIINISLNMFAIAYHGADDDGFVSTITISNEGDIAAAVTDTFEFETGSCYQPEIIHITDDVFAVAYQGPTPNGIISTFTISALGDIGASIIDTFNFAVAGAYFVDIVAVSGGFFAICYQGPLEDGFLCTFSINNDGTINDGTLETFEFDPAQCSYPVMLHVTGNIYAIAYQGVDSDGFLKSVNIETIALAGIKHLPFMGIG